MMHGKQNHTEQQLLEQIACEVGVKLSQLQNVKRDTVNCDLIAAWPIADSVFVHT